MVWMVEGSKVNVTGSHSAKHIEGDGVAGVSLLAPLSSAHPLLLQSLHVGLKQLQVKPVVKVARSSRRLMGRRRRWCGEFGTFYA